MERSAEELLNFLFDEVLPRHGMALRIKQKELSLEMLQALQEDKLALCEAEVGTGKTHAYILALTVHNLYSDKKAPAVISTSTIALQKALTEEYIPQISGILLEHHVIDVVSLILHLHTLASTQYRLPLPVVNDTMLWSFLGHIKRVSIYLYTECCRLNTTVLWNLP